MGGDSERPSGVPVLRRRSVAVFPGTGGRKVGVKRNQNCWGPPLAGNRAKCRVNEQRWRTYDVRALTACPASASKNERLSLPEAQSEVA